MLAQSDGEIMQLEGYWLDPWLLQIKVSLSDTLTN